MNNFKNCSVNKKIKQKLNYEFNFQNNKTVIFSISKQRLQKNQQKIKLSVEALGRPVNI